MAATIGWYESVGFEVDAINQQQGHPPDWAQLTFDAAAVMVTAGGDAGDQNASLYFTTSDVEAAYGELRDQAELLEPIHTAFHGMREFTLVDPNGFMLTFGQRVQAPPESMHSP